MKSTKKYPTVFSSKDPNITLLKQNAIFTNIRPDVYDHIVDIENSNVWVIKSVQKRGSTYECSLSIHTSIS